MKIDSDGINLDIIQGKAQMVHGQQETFSRLLNVAFYYNRTFSKVPENDDPIHNAGSWTMSMRRTIHCHYGQEILAKRKRKHKI